MHSSARSIKHSSFVIERRYDFDPAQVYRAWVNPEAKARWFSGPPEKWSEEVREMDVRGTTRATGYSPSPRYPGLAFTRAPPGTCFTFTAMVRNFPSSAVFNGE